MCLIVDSILKYQHLSRFFIWLTSAKLMGHEMKLKQCASARCKPALHYVISRYRAVDTQCYLLRSKGRGYNLYQTLVCLSQHMASSQAAVPP